MITRTFPLLDLQLPALKALVVGLGVGLIVRVVVLGKVGMDQSFSRSEPFISVQNQHLLKQIHSCWNSPEKT